jgi:hypothetical protein
MSVHDRKNLSDGGQAAYVAGAIDLLRRAQQLANHAKAHGFVPLFSAAEIESEVKRLGIWVERL